MEEEAQRSHQVCLLAVPSSLSCQDLIAFTAACHDHMKHLRIIRPEDSTSSPNHYMALIEFRSQVEYTLMLILNALITQSLNFLLSECCRWILSFFSRSTIQLTFWRRALQRCLRFWGRGGKRGWLLDSSTWSHWTTHLPCLPGEDGWVCWWNTDHTV